MPGKQVEKDDQIASAVVGKIAGKNRLAGCSTSILNYQLCVNEFFVWGAIHAGGETLQRMRTRNGYHPPHDCFTLDGAGGEPYPFLV